MSENLSEIQMERRRYPRFPVQLEIHYQCLKKNSQSNFQMSRTKDVSTGGLAMYTTHRLEKNQMLMLTLCLPQADAAECLKTFILAKVVWNRSIDSRSHLQGIQFIDLKHEDRSRLRQFLIEHPAQTSTRN